MNAISVQTGKVFVQTNTSSSIATINLTPNVDARLTTLATLYELYRFTWLKITMFPTDNATNNEHAVGIVPDYPSGSSGTPASLAAIVELPISMYMANRMIQPQFIVVPRNQMIGRNALKWWQTDQSSPSEESIQSRIYAYANQATLTTLLMIEYVLEFTNPIPAAVTLSRERLVLNDALLGNAIDGLTREQRMALLRRIAGLPVDTHHGSTGSPGSLAKGEIPNLIGPSG